MPPFVPLNKFPTSNVAELLMYCILCVQYWFHHDYNIWERNPDFNTNILLGPGIEFEDRIIPRIRMLREIRKYMKTKKFKNANTTAVCESWLEQFIKPTCDEYDINLYPQNNKTTHIRMACQILRHFIRFDDADSDSYYYSQVYMNNKKCFKNHGYSIRDYLCIIPREWDDVYKILVEQEKEELTGELYPKTEYHLVFV